MSDVNDTQLGVGLGIWVCFCFLIAMWLFTRFLKGKQALYSDLHVVEDSLRRMQEHLELEQRKKSIGVVENLEEITDQLMKELNQTRPTAGDDSSESPNKGSEPSATETKPVQESSAEDQETEEDKKNI